jgi:hypothetical protein
MPRLRSFLPLLAVAFALAPGLSAQPKASSNLLDNGNFQHGELRSVPRWVFPVSVRDRLATDHPDAEWGVQEGPDRNFHLFLATKRPGRAHFWVQQEVEVAGGATCTLTLRISGSTDELGGFASPDIGLYFLDSAGKWISYQRLPGASLSETWTPQRLVVITPDNTVRVGVRLGLSCSVPATLRFDDVVLEAK